MCAPDSIRSARCLLRGCPDDGHANDQMKFPDRNTLIQSDLKFQPDNEWAQSVVELPSDCKCFHPRVSNALFVGLLVGVEGSRIQAGLAMWNSDSRQWSTASGYQSDRDWNRGKQWSSSTNDWWGTNKDTNKDANLIVPAPNPVIPAKFKSDDKFFDSTAVGSGNHQFHRVIQSTDWSRKAQLAGRPVDDLRVHELCFRGLSEFSLRMLSEGRFQSIVFTRNSADSAS